MALSGKKLGDLGAILIVFVETDGTAVTGDTTPTAKKYKASTGAETTLVKDTDYTWAEVGSGLYTLTPIASVFDAVGEYAITAVDAGATAQVCRRLFDVQTSEIDDLSTAASLATTAAEVWTNATRTLTNVSASTQASRSGTVLNILRGDHYSTTLTGLGSIADRSKLWFTVKRTADDADSEALIQILLTTPADAGDGLQLLNGAATTAAYGSITVVDEDTGSITLALSALATEDLEQRDCVYDIQMLTVAGVVSTPLKSSVTLDVSEDITRATS